MPYQTGQRVGDYEIEQFLGAGGVGEVYSASHLVTGRRDALKVLRSDLTADTEQAKRFLQEIQIQAKLSHPNIAAVHSALWNDGDLVMALELVEGRSLRAWLDSGELEIEQALSYLRQGLAALSHAHANGVVHRDISPQNLLVRDDGVVKLTDFGLAKAAAETQLTKTGAVIGSLYYMAPEQVRGTKKIDARSDLYSIGAILYEALSGQPPFQGENVFDLVADRLRGQPVPIEKLTPGAEPALLEAVAKAMDPKPSKRFANAEEFLRALPEEKLPAIAPPIARIRAPRRNRRIRRWAAAAGLAAAAFATLFAVAVESVMTRPVPRLDPPPVATVGPPSFAYMPANPRATPAPVVQAAVRAPNPTLVPSPTPDLPETPDHLTAILDAVDSELGSPVAIRVPERTPTLAAPSHFRLAASHSAAKPIQPGGVRFGPQGQAVVWRDSHELNLWRPDEKPRSLALHPGGESVMDFANAGNLLFVGSADGSVRILDVTTGRERLVLGHRRAVKALATSSDAQYLAVALEGRGFHVWRRVSEYGYARENPGDFAKRTRVLDVAFAPDGRTLVWAARDSGPLTNLVPPLKWIRDDPVRRVHSLKSGLRIVGLPFRDEAEVTLARGTELTVAGVGDGFDVRDAAGEPRMSGVFAPGQLLSLGLVDGRKGYALLARRAAVVIWDLETRREISALHLSDVPAAAALSPDASRLTTVSHDVIQSWDIDPALRALLSQAPADRTITSIEPGSRELEGAPARRDNLSSPVSALR